MLFRSGGAGAASCAQPTEQASPSQKIPSVTTCFCMVLFSGSLFAVGLSEPQTDTRIGLDLLADRNRHSAKQTHELDLEGWPISARHPIIWGFGLQFSERPKERSPPAARLRENPDFV